MLGSEKKKKKKCKEWVETRNYGTFTFPDHCTSSRAPFSALKPYLVAVCDAHDIWDLPRLLPDRSSLDHRRWWIKLHGLRNWWMIDKIGNLSPSPRKRSSPLNLDMWHSKSTSSKSKSSLSEASSTDGFWGLLSLPRLLSWAFVALDCRPMLVYGFWRVFVLFSWFFAARRAPAMSLLCHVMLLYKPQNVLD